MFPDSFIQSNKSLDFIGVKWGLSSSFVIQKCEGFNGQTLQYHTLPVGRLDSALEDNFYWKFAEWKAQSRPASADVVADDFVSECIVADQPLQT